MGLCQHIQIARVIRAQPRISPRRPQRRQQRLVDIVQHRVEIREPNRASGVAIRQQPIDISYKQPATNNIRRNELAGQARHRGSLIQQPRPDRPALAMVVFGDRIQQPGIGAWLQLEHIAGIARPNQRIAEGGETTLADRPTVIAASDPGVHLLDIGLADIVDEHRPGPAAHPGQVLRVAKPIGPDRLFLGRLSDERIVGRHRERVAGARRGIETQHLAIGVGGILPVGQITSIVASIAH